MATYQHRGKWYYDFLLGNARHRKGGFKTKSQALTAEKNLKKSLLTNETFATICRKRLLDLEVRRTARYYRENERLIAKLERRWANKKLITRDDIENWLTEQKSASQANKELKMIKRLFQHAVEREWLETNPAKNVKSLPVARKRKYIPPQEDIIRFLVEAGPERFYFLTIILTLGRMREINYLKWEDVFPDHLILKTRKARNSDTVERKIPISETLKYVLERIPRKGDYVFCRENGKPFDCRKKLMAGICKRAEIKPFSFHSLRHFGASKLAEAGAPLTAVQSILGHSRASTTDTYLQSLGTKKTEVMNQLFI
jgi:integrase